MISDMLEFLDKKYEDVKNRLTEAQSLLQQEKADAESEEDS